MAIVGSAIAAKSTLDIAILLEVFITLPMGYDPPKWDRIRIVDHRPLRLALIIKRATDAPSGRAYSLQFPVRLAVRQHSRNNPCGSFLRVLVGRIMNKAVIGFAAIAALIGTPAFAADMALKAPPIPSQIYSWSGCYVGGTVGGAFGRSSYSGDPTGDFRTPEPIGEPSIIPNLSAITTGALDPSSVIGGGEIGCNWQINSVVIGLEGDFGGWNLSKSSC